MSSTDLSNTLAIRFTRFFMKWAGFWIWNDRISKIKLDLAMCYSVITIFLAMILTASDLYFSRTDFHNAAYAACNVMTIFIVLFKLIFFAFRRGPFTDLIKFCHEHFWQGNYDSFGGSVLRGCETRCIYFVGTLTFFGQATVFSYTLHPIIENIGKNDSDRIHPITIWLNFPTTTTPYYEILFFIETASIFHSGICYFCFDNLLYVMNVHAAGQFQILQKRFERMCFVSGLDERKESLISNDDNLSTGRSADPYVQYNEFKDCVQKHQLLIRFARMIEEVYTIVILCQFVVFSLLICLVSYQAVLADGALSRRMIFIVHSGGTFAQLLMFTLTCDTLTQESQEVAQAAYRARWYCNLSDPMSRKVGKGLIFVTMRCRRPCYLTAGGFFPVSLETFTTILSTSMSYLTMLRHGQED